MESKFGKRYTTVVHVRWELPFPLMLREEAFMCWEPGEGVGAFVPSEHIGTILWKRTCSFLEESAVFDSKPRHQDNESLPVKTYQIRCVLENGSERTTAEIYGGPQGGFAEARPYTVANIFLCASPPTSYRDASVIDRACSAVNNVIDIYRFLTMDPLPRPIVNKEDHYCTVVSEGLVPEVLQQLPPMEALRHIGEIRFGSIIGKNRAQVIGLDTLDDLKGNRLHDAALPFYYDLVKQEHRLELFHQLVFSAIRRLKRKEGTLAVIDAQSAFEVAVASMLKDGLKAGGWTDNRINEALAYGGDLHLLQSRLKKLDSIARGFKATPVKEIQAFLGSRTETQWRQKLYNLRNEIVHGGRRLTTFHEAKEAIIAGLKAVNHLHSLCPYFERHFMWTGQALELQHLNESAGRLTRLFES